MSIATITETTQFLTFILENENYAIDVSRVREVLEMSSITKIPQTQNFMRGVINLRGSVVPVIDLKLKFGMQETEKTIDTCIVVMEVSIEGEKDVVVLGALSDSVQEVIDLDPEQIEPAPKIGSGVNRDFIKGMGKRNDNFIIILDIDKIFSKEDLDSIQSTVDIKDKDTDDESEEK